MPASWFLQFEILFDNRAKRTIAAISKFFYVVIQCRGFIVRLKELDLWLRVLGIT